MGKSSSRPSTIKIWTTAARPHTLTASLCPCIVSYAHCNPPYLWFLYWLLFCFTIQIGTNLHNDYSDYVQGTDTDKRVGQKRATAQGWLSPEQTCTAATLTLSVTFLSGVMLMQATETLDSAFVWFLVVSSVFNAFAYTAGPYPLGYIGLAKCSIAYSGLGDVFVFLYFGLVATWMLPYLMERQEILDKSWSKIYGTQVGLLAMNILVVNNLRDRLTDVETGKRTTSVRFGRKFSLVQYILCWSIPYVMVVLDWMNSNSTHRLLPMLTIPLAVSETRAIMTKEGAQLNPHVGGAAKVQLAFCVLLSVALATTT